MFASVGREVADAEKDEGKVGDDVGGDPLSFKPDLRGMMNMFEEEEGGNGMVSSKQKNSRGTFNARYICNKLASYIFNKLMSAKRR